MRAAISTSISCGPRGLEYLALRAGVRSCKGASSPQLQSNYPHVPKFDFLNGCHVVDFVGYYYREHEWGILGHAFFAFRRSFLLRMARLGCNFSKCLSSKDPEGTSQVETIITIIIIVIIIIIYYHF